MERRVEQLLDSIEGDFENFDFGSEVFGNLRQNYEERLAKLEEGVLRTISNLQTDEMLHALGKDQTTEEFRWERLEEIIHQSIFSEKESEISRLCELNAFILSHLKPALLEKNQLASELDQYKSGVEEIAEQFKVIEEQKTALEEEVQNLRQTIEEISSISDVNIRAQKSETQTKEVDHLRQVMTLKKDLEEANGRISLLEVEVRSKTRQLESKQNEAVILGEKCKKMEERLEELGAESQSMNNLINEMSSTIETLSEEKETGLSSIAQLKKEIESQKAKMDKVSKEKNESQKTVQALGVQAKKTAKEAQEKEEHIREEAKEELRTNMKKMKKEIKGLMKEKGELVRELGLIGQKAKEEAKEFEKNKEGLKEQIRQMRIENEKRMAEYEQVLREQEEAHKQEMTRLEGQYEEILERKVIEVKRAAEEQQNSAMNSHNTSSCNHKLDVSSSIQPNLNIERDYVLKSKHESLMESEIFKLKSKFLSELQASEEHIRSESDLRAKENVRQKTEEFNLVLEGLQRALDKKESKLSGFRAENNQLRDKREEIEEELQKIREDLEKTKRQLDHKNKEIAELSKEIAELQDSRTEEPPDMKTPTLSPNRSMDQGIQRPKEHDEKPYQRLFDHEREFLELKRENENLLTKLESIESEFLQEKEEKSAISKKYQESLKAAEEQAKQSNENIQTLEESLKKAINEKKQLESNFQKTKSALESVLTKCEELNSQTESMKIENEEKGKKIKKQTKVIQKLEDKLANIRVQLEKGVLRELDRVRKESIDLKSTLEQKISDIFVFGKSKSKGLMRLKALNISQGSQPMAGQLDAMGADLRAMEKRHQEESRALYEGMLGLQEEAKKWEEKARSLSLELEEAKRENEKLKGNEKKFKAKMKAVKKESLKEVEKWAEEMDEKFKTQIKSMSEQIETMKKSHQEKIYTLQEEAETIQTDLQNELSSAIDQLQAAASKHQAIRQELAGVVKAKEEAEEKALSLEQCLEVETREKELRERSLQDMIRLKEEYRKEIRLLRNQFQGQEEERGSRQPNERASLHGSKRQDDSVQEIQRMLHHSFDEMNRSIEKNVQAAKGITQETNRIQMLNNTAKY